MSGISERNPFVGPRPIEQGEPLYGRDVEVRELYNRLQARRIVVLHSPSGAGKSSLVQAGLIPRLVEGGYDVWKAIRVNLDPGDLDDIPEGTNRFLLSAMISLEDELPEANRRSPAALARIEFLDYLEKRPRRKGRGGQPVVLIFDQSRRCSRWRRWRWRRSGRSSRRWERRLRARNTGPCSSSARTTWPRSRHIDREPDRCGLSTRCPEHDHGRVGPFHGR